jgi:hypothetical protein
MLQGDSMHNAAALLVPLLNKGMKLLVYAGKAGMPFCDFFHVENLRNRSHYRPPV